MPKRYGKNIRHYSVLMGLSLICGGLSLGMMSVAEVGEAPEVGRNAAVKGEVKIRSVEEEVSRQAVVKEPVYLGDRVNSKIGASLQVLLKDNSTFTVGPQCDMVIDKFVYDPDKQSNTLSAKVKKGMFRFTSGNISKTNPDNITVETPTATMGIRGTMVEVLVGPEAFLCAEKEGLLSKDIFMNHAGATLVILRGPGENNTSANRNGEVEISSGGKVVKLTESGTGVLVSNENRQPSEPFIVSDSLFNYFSRRLRTKPVGEVNFKPFIIDESLFTPIPQDGLDGELISPFESIDETDWPSQLIDGLEVAPGN